jgi:hypothetical protein
MKQRKTLFLRKRYKDFIDNDSNIQKQTCFL